MKRKYIFLTLVAGLLMALPVLAACDGEETPSTSKPTPVPFSIEVYPVLMEDTIAGQSCIFLVHVNDEEPTEESKPVYITAESDNATVTAGPRAIAPGSIAEVVVVAEDAIAGQTITVNIEGERDGLVETETVNLKVQLTPHGIDELTNQAIEMLAKFTPWLEENYPDLNITKETEWTATLVYPTTQGEVKYFLFFSEDWEVGIRWNTTEGEEDWVRMYLRYRTAELAPSKGFEISSASDENEEPHTITPPNAVWR